jgi:hypothetical protein
MMSLFDEEQIMRTYAKDCARETAKETSKETAKRMIRKGKMSLDEIAECVPILTMEELKEIESEVMHLA